MSATPAEPLLALVATTRYLLLVDLQRKTVTPLENHRPEYYGISWFPGDPELVLSHSALDNATLLDLASYALSEVGYLSHGATATPGHLSAPHQILCAPDGKVICCNTGRNTIALLDPAQPDTVREARLSPWRWDRLSPADFSGEHLNSVFLAGDLLYVMAHRHNKGAELITLSYPELREIAREPIPGKSGLHNVWVSDEGQKIGCDSETASVIDLENGCPLWESAAQVFTRGLAASDDVVVVGESARTGRDLRGASAGGLWLIDRKTWQTLDYIFLGPYGAVHEVRLLNVPDHAHHGHCFAGSAALSRRHLGNGVAEERMQAAKLAWQHRGDWADHAFVFGAAQRGGDGALVATQNSLCLLCQGPALAAAQGAGRSLAFRYGLNAQDSHVSVVSYHGKGADSDMHALLIERVNGGRARLNLWIHDGLEWKLEPGSLVEGLPVAAQVSMLADETEIRLDIDGETVFTCPAARMHLAGGRLGIRWLNASIYRVRDADAG